MNLGKYELHEEIGKGGFGTVYRAVHRSLGSEVALKVLRLVGTESSAYQRFIREAQTAAGLEHPNIVRVLDLSEEEGQLYIAMEYYPAGDLARWVKEHGGPDRTTCMQILNDIAAALDYAHAQGAFHRDVKPANILLDAEGHAHLSDFGLVLMPDSPNLTQIGGVVGSPTYMAPEQAEGSPLDGRADQYSLAVVAYELFVGRPPFIGNTSTAISLMHLTDPPPPPSSLNSQVPTEVDEVFIRALSKKPADRYPACGIFVTALQDAYQVADQRLFQEGLDEAHTALQKGDAGAARKKLASLLRLSAGIPQAKILLEKLESSIHQTETYQTGVKAWNTARTRAQQVLANNPAYPDREGVFGTLKLRAQPKLPFSQLAKQIGIGLLVSLPLALILLGLFWLWVDRF